MECLCFSKFMGYAWCGKWGKFPQGGKRAHGSIPKPDIISSFFLLEFVFSLYS